MTTTTATAAAAANDDNDSTAHKKCGLTELILFTIAVITGTACSICSKTMMQLHAVGMTGEMETFEKPLFQTIGMFIGMLFGIVMHVFVLTFRIPFPGYVFDDNNNNNNNSTTSTNDIEQPSTTNKNKNDGSAPTERDALLGKSKTTEPTPQEQERPQNHVPLWMYFFLMIPAIFDVGATVLCMMGLRYINVSIYQMLRGSGIIFVAIMKQHVLKDRLYNFQWLGVFWNVISVVLVGATALLSSVEQQQQQATADDDDDDDNSSSGMSSTTRALLGVVLVLLGAFVQSLQFIFEEKVMTQDIPSPPLLLIGMEGFWGTVICLVVLYPLAYFTPGDDHGCYEDFFNTWYMLANSATIQWWFLVYFFAIFGYNLFAVLVTFMLNSIWHAILDNFRPITIWGTSMTMYYFIATEYGEAWTPWSWLQLVGMLILFYGTSIYNAPNMGSVALRGEWFSLGFNFSAEYDDIHRRLEDERRHDEWLHKRADFAERRTSGSFAGEWLGTDRM